MDFSSLVKSLCLLSFSLVFSSIRSPSPRPVSRNLASWETMEVLFLMRRKESGRLRSLEHIFVDAQNSLISSSSYDRLLLCSTFLAM